MVNLIKAWFINPLMWIPRLVPYPTDLNQEEQLPKPIYPNRLGDWFYNTEDANWYHLGDPRSRATESMNNYLTEARQQANAANAEAVDQLYEEFVRQPSAASNFLGLHGIEWAISMR